MKTFPQTHNKPDCTVVDIYCTNDKDCHIHCNSSAHSTLSHDLLGHDDHSTVTIYLCNRITKQCEPHIIRRGFHDMAIKNLNYLLDKEKELPQDFLHFLKLNNGKYFILSRCRFYESLSLHLSEGNNLDIAIQSIKNEHNIQKEKHLNEKIRLFKNENIINDSDIDLIRSYKLLPYNNNKNEKLLKAQPPFYTNSNKETMNMPLYMQNLFGYRSPTSISSHVILSGAYDYQETRGDYVQHVYAKFNNNHNTSNQDEPTGIQREFYCNEEMHAGIMTAAFRDKAENKILPICICIHPDYLTGPTCKHRTYTNVIDYDQWEKTGIAEFLTDPFNDYNKANSICKKYTTNTTAVFDEREGTFKCQPLAAHLAQSLQFRGPYEPSLILDRDFLNIYNKNQPEGGRKLNIEYLDLLRKFW
uniref:Wsv306-like protein n=1 Tax=Trachysalambria curvirostris majanivirus TaxID=2984281 RepID=A0A9C7F750_9VIRU|nr:MAG: wsv306-like protein [Trachysalambria curvirostris majanivirus]